MRVIGGIAGSGPAAPVRAASPPIAPAIRLSSEVRRAVAPVVLAYVIERASDEAGLMLVAAFAVVALACFAAIRPAQKI
jgi:hypothetical protein